MRFIYYRETIKWRQRVKCTMEHLKMSICQMELMEIWLIPSDCRFSVWGTRIQLLVMVFIYYLFPLKPLPPCSNSNWQGWFSQLLQGSQRSSFQEAESHLTRWLGSKLYGTFLQHKPNPWQSENRRNVSESEDEKRCFSRAERVDCEKQMRWTVKLIDRGWYNMGDTEW